MPTYVYETVPKDDSGRTKTYEIQQSIHDAPLTRHPETGEPIRKVPAGSVGILSGAASAPSGGGGCCGGGGCGCAH